jgi:hypothetical protein
MRMCGTSAGLQKCCSKNRRANDQIDMEALRRVFLVTRSIWVGPFASPERRAALITNGITHILNVGEAPSVLTTVSGPFQEVAWHPIVDLERVPDEAAVAILAKLHAMVCQPNASVYVHCMAGWNRSPTIVWLYLVACGMDQEEAKRVVTRHAWDAVPGHPRMVDAGLIASVVQFGKAMLLPHRRPESIEPLADG